MTPVESADGAGDLSGELALHRSFVVALGGFVLEFAGGALVTHERIAVPAFNYVDLDRLAPDRQTAFFERALDHYFQRAIRPSFRARRPVPAHVDRSLRAFGFVPAGIRKNYYAEVNEDGLVMWAHDIDTDAYEERIDALLARVEEAEGG